MALGTKIGSAYFEVIAATGGFGDTLQAGVVNAITARTAVLGDAMERLGKALFTRFTIPLGVATAANLIQFQRLERSISETLTLFNTAPSQVNRTFSEMTAGIRSVSEAVGGLESDIADGLYQTISAGVPKGDAFEFLEVAQIAATADKTADLTQAVDGLTTGLNAFGLEASEASRVSDVLFAGVAKGKTTFGELGDDIGRVFPLAAAAGGTLEETTAIIAQLTAQGLKTSEAISFLRAAITGLLRPGEEMNAIFEEIGFASSEAAIPVLGLQGAFDAVVQSAGGSTSKLQELIGTSEGVLAILGITGENAEKFAGTLDFITDSAGLTNQAFEIVDATFSRSFGRLTESFDRLGNLFGGLGAQFAQPVVDTITGVVNEVIDNFEKLIPFLATIAQGFALLVSTMQSPVFKEFAAGLATIVLTFGGLLGVLGAILIPLGFFIKGLSASIVALRLIGPASIGLKSLGKVANAAGGGMLFLASKITGTSIAMSTASQTLSFFGKTFQVSLAQITKFSIGLLAVAAAVAAVVIIAKEYSEVLKDIDDQTLITSIATDRLAESMGIVLKPLGELATFADDGTDINFAFSLANSSLLTNVKETLDLLGEQAAKDQIIRISYELFSRGATLGEIETFIDRITEVTGIDLSFGDVSGQLESGEALFTGINQQIEKAIDLSERFGDGTSIAALQGPLDSLDSKTRRVQTAYKDLADSLVQIRITEGPEKFVAALDLVEQAIAGTNVEDFFVDSLLNSFDEAADGGTNFSTGMAQNFEDLRGELERGLPFYSELSTDFDEIAGSAGRAQEALSNVDLTGGLPSDIEEFGIAVTKTIPGVVQLTSEQISVLQTLKSNIGDILQAGEDVILTTFNNIRSGLVTQMPLLGVYQGAVKVAFQEWKDGQDAFQADIAATTLLRGKIKEALGPELLAVFDKAAITDKVWLTKLGEAELKVALDEMQETLGAVNDSAATIWEQDLPNTLDRANAAMQLKYDEMITAAGDTGTGVAQLWQINFERESKTWVGAAAAAITEITGILNTTIPGPTVGPISIQPGGSFGTTQEEDPTNSQFKNQINFYNSPSDTIVRDSQIAGSLIEANHP